jgi:hypothetical protein
MKRADTEAHHWAGPDLHIHVKTEVGKVNPILAIGGQHEGVPLLTVELGNFDLHNLESAIATLRQIKDAKRSDKPQKDGEPT